MGRKKKKRQPLPRPRVSLCMIVRDEATMLPDCLASAREAVDEIVVVDTGSVDGTPEVAAAAGAKVIHRPWDDDFAAARNASLAAATGDWLLVLDADERLARGAGKVIRLALQRDDFDCGLLPLHNAARADADVEAVRRGRDCLSETSFLPRLLRRTDDLAFEGVIHENVTSWLLRGERTRVLTGADIVHLGYAATVQTARQKYARDLALLEKAIDRDPHDPTYYGYLALSHLEAGEVASSRRVAEEGWAFLPEPERGTEVVALRLAVARAATALDGGDYDRALETIDVGQRHWPNHPDLWFLQACTAEALVHDAHDGADRRTWLEEAERSFRETLAQRDGFFVQRFLSGATSWATWLRLGALALLRGRHRDAHQAFARAEQEGGPADLCDLGRAEAYLDQGQTARAAKLIDRHLRRTDSARADAYLLGALVAEQKGDLSAMGKLLVETRHQLGGDFAAIHRRARFFDAVAVMALHHGEHVEAPGPFGQLAVLLRGELRPVKGGAARPADPSMLDRLLRRLVARGHADALGHLLQPAAAPLLPGIGAALTRVVDGMSLQRAAG